mgnify:CR=1 FL=1
MALGLESLCKEFVPKANDSGELFAVPETEIEEGAVEPKVQLVITLVSTENARTPAFQRSAIDWVAW